MRHHVPAGRRLGPVRRRLGAGLIVAFATGVLGTAAPTAAAIVRFASPSGSGSACTQANPCSLSVAIQNAPNGATVKVVGDEGTYTQAAGIDAERVTIMGVRGRPSIVFSGDGLSLSRATASNLAIEGTGDKAALFMDQGSAGSRLWVKASGTSHACALMGGTKLTNVLCWAHGPADKALEVKGATTLRNVTAFGGTEAALAIVGYDICGCEKFAVTLVNTILWSPGGTDIAVTSDLPDITIKPTYSNYRTVNAVEDGADIRLVKSTTNQTKVGRRPLFLDKAGGNLRPAKGSPVIDRGVTAEANGAVDLDGRKRRVGQRTDIGAYESSPPNTTITGGPSGTVNGNPVAFTFTSSRGESTFQCRSDGAVSWTVCSSPWDLGWSGGKHTFRVRAVDSLGYRDPTPATRTFTVVP